MQSSQKSSSPFHGIHTPAAGSSVSVVLSSNFPFPSCLLYAGNHECYYAGWNEFDTTNPGGSTTVSQENLGIFVVIMPEVLTAYEIDGGLSNG